MFGTIHGEFEKYDPPQDQLLYFEYVRRHASKYEFPVSGPAVKSYIQLTLFFIVPYEHADRAPRTLESVNLIRIHG